MGSKFTVLENRTYYRIEMRSWVYPSRPDRFDKVIAIGPRRSVTIKSEYFNPDLDESHHHRCGDLESQDHDHDHHQREALIMVYASGGWSGNIILPLHLMTYAKVTCDSNQQGQVILRGRRAYFNFCRRFKFSANFLLKNVGMEMAEEEL